MAAFFLLLLWLVFGITLNVYCQDASFKYIKNYTRKEYGGQSQNWSILQDKHGIIYVGNQLGLLEFDGGSWRTIDIKNNLVKSMAIDDTGTIYVGGIDEIGFLAPVSKGGLQYVSLLEHLPINKRSFSYVWETHWTKQGIYFKTSKFLFRWNPNNKKIRVWESNNKFHLSFICKGKLFIRQENVGLMKMDTDTDSLKVVPGGETFAGKKIYMVAPYDNKKLLIGTRASGFYTYDIDNGIEAVPFPSEADNYLKDNQLYHGTRLSSGDFALATLRGGLVIIDSQGSLKEIFNKSSGLQDDNIKYVFEDFQGNLWLAMDKGISKIEYVSPLSIYDDRSNLPGSVLSVTRHNKDLYAGTSRGLFFLAPPHGFRPVAGISSYCWFLLSIKNSLLAATADGVFQVDGKDNDNINHRVTQNGSYFLLPSKREPNRIWVGTVEGLVSLYSTGENGNGKWKKEHQFENIMTQIRTIVEDKKGNLWLGTRTKGVLKVDFLGPDNMNHPLVTRYHSSHGLPPGGIGVFRAASYVMFATDKGIFRFDEANKRFIPDSTLGEVFADGSRGVFRILEDKNKNIWVHSNSRNFQVIPQPEGDSTTFVIYKKPFLRIPDVQVNSLYPDPDGIVTWFASDEGLIRYDFHVKKNYDHDFPTLIRKVLANGNLVFSGYQTKYKRDKDSKSPFPIFDYQVRNIAFEFAAPFFEVETETQYQCFLEGYDDHWSALNSETRKDYINLDSGLYTFRVRGQNVYGHLSSEAVFQFKILLPWYRTWWAYLSYVLVLFMLTYLLVKWRHFIKLEKEKQRLEQTVKERTKEINEKNQQLEEKSEKLKEIDILKSRFFANISHEFRTPLTLIIGPLEQMLSADIENETERTRKLTMMLRNSHRLLGLINKLMELSKFESGKVKLQACRQNIIPFLKGTVVSFDPVANKKDLDLTFHAEEENITLYFDLGELEEILFNLLSNAVKFTPAGGKVTVTVTKNPKKEANFPSGLIEISICDTGPGISGDQLAHIFNRFFQSDTTREHHQKGSGIGLAIVKELVDLHHGEIVVHSSEGENSGTEFIIRLPMGDMHLKPEEIVTPSEKLFKHKNLEEIELLYMIEREPEVPAEVKTATADSKKTSATEKDMELEAHEKNIILLVEDSADFRDYIRESLGPLYAVVEAKDGREGIQKAQKIIPDLIISDIMMPEVDGYALCRVLKNDIKTSHIPIILLTAKASEENIVKGLETGADDYVTKPFSTKILCVRIKNLIDLRRQLQLKRKRQMTMQPTEISVSSVDENFFKDLQDVIEKNLSDSEFNVEKLGKRLYMSRASLYRKIMALTGDPPLQFIRSYRLKRAAQLLKANFGNVTEVALEVGFCNIAHFSQCFKEEFHQSPSTFQASESVDQWINGSVGQ